MKPHYEHFDHTADMGIRVYAPTRAELIPAATEGFYAVIGTLVPGEARDSVAWRFPGTDPALALRDYLAKLLLLFECDGRMIVPPHSVDWVEECLTVEAPARLMDESASEFLREVKAVTYHDLGVRRTPGGFVATVIVDI